MSEEGTLSTVVGAAPGRAGRSVSEPRNVPEEATLPGVGPRTLAATPSDARQVVLVTGAGPDSADSSVTLYHDDPITGWTPEGPAWSGHNALHGWTGHHHTGDLRSPIGVFGLTDAGGRRADPGTKFGYDHAPIGFDSPGTGFHGESLAGAFDYVIAVNYNRVPGTSPRLGPPAGPVPGRRHLAARRPRRAHPRLCRASGVGHEESAAHARPARHPVVVMGDARSLAH